MCKSCVKEATKTSAKKKIILGVLLFPWATLIAGAVMALKAIEPFLHSLGICTGL